MISKMNFKYRIKFFSDFCNTETCKQKFEEMCQINTLSNYGEDKNVYFVTDDSYTHAVILNKATPDLHLPKENVIGLACEPYEFLHIDENFVKYAKQYISKYYIGDKRELSEPFVEGFGYMWHIRPEKNIENKSKLMSIIISQKVFAPGHQYRHNIANCILMNNLPVDIYGRGCHMHSHNHSASTNIKGEFNEVEPYKDYLFTICIENFQNNHYISEKIMTPLMYNCMPIYIGCKNITQYFNEVILLTGELEKDMNTIVDILNNPLKYYIPTSTEKNKMKINLVQNVEKIFSSY
jgi:hypothetical protein